MALEANIETINTPSGTTAIVTLIGLLTLGTNLKTADQQIQMALAQGARNLVLDLTGVEFSDSAGLGMLVHTFGLVRAQGGQMRIFGVGSRIAYMLKLTTTDKILIVDANREASLAALG